MATFFGKKIVYHLCEADDVPGYLDKGMSRIQGRQYVFEDWAIVQHYLSLVVLEDPNSKMEINKYVILVLSIDPDMLLAGPLVARRVVDSVDERRWKEIDSNTHYLEVDLNPERILDVKDPFGNSIIARYKDRRTPPNPY